MTATAPPAGPAWTWTSTTDYDRPIDPLTLIVGALAAGATSALTDSATDAVKSAYGALKGLITRRLGGTPEAEMLVEQHEAKPEVWRAPIEDALKTASADEDTDLVAAAQRLMELVDPAGANSGKYSVVNQGTVQGQTIGDGNVVTQHFGSPKAE